jgi:hypothetical protein
MWKPWNPLCSRRTLTRTSTGAFVDPAVKVTLPTATPYVLQRRADRLRLGLLGEHDRGHGGQRGGGADGGEEDSEAHRPTVSGAGGACAPSRRARDAPRPSDRGAALTRWAC